MEILEKDLEDMIFNADQQDVIDKGLFCFDHQNIIRQLNLGAYGIADLVGITIRCMGGKYTAFITIYELKKDSIGLAALGQVSRYEKAMYEHFEKIDFDLCYVKIVLIGSDIEKSSNFVYVASKILNLDCFTYSFDINGLDFDHVDTSEYRPGNVEEGLGGLNKIDFKSLLKEETKTEKLIPEPAF